MSNCEMLKERIKTINEEKQKLKEEKRELKEEIQRLREKHEKIKKTNNVKTVIKLNAEVKRLKDDRINNMIINKVIFKSNELIHLCENQLDSDNQCYAKATLSMTKDILKYIGLLGRDGNVLDFVK